MRVAFFGTSSFAVAVLRRVAESGHRASLVVTPPDRPRGRGRRLASPPAAECARELGLELLQTESVNRPDALARIRADRPEIGLVCAFGQLIRAPLLDELELLNVHPSLLPRWRGAAPIERAIIAGDQRTGVTIIRVTAELDAGPIALREEVELGDGDFAAVSTRLERLAGELSVRALDLAAAGELAFRAQDESEATYAAKIDPAERRLDTDRPAPELERLVRALHPHIGAYIELEGGTRLGVREARAEQADLEPGAVAASDGLLVGCAAGALRLLTVQPPGGRAMDVGSYLRGHPAPGLAR